MPGTSVVQDGLRLETLLDDPARGDQGGAFDQRVRGFHGHTTLVCPIFLCCLKPYLIFHRHYRLLYAHPTIRRATYGTRLNRMMPILNSDIPM